MAGDVRYWHLADIRVVSLMSAFGVRAGIVRNSAADMSASTFYGQCTRILQRSASGLKR